MGFMKKILLLIPLMLISLFGLAQKKSKKVEDANLTQEQRLTRATDRKTKGGKKEISMEKKIKTAKKEDRKARKTKKPKIKKSKMKKRKHNG